MPTAAIIVAFDVAEDFRADFLTIPEFAAVNPFDLERMEEALGSGVVVAASRAAHALADAGKPETIAESLAGVLASTIRMKDQARQWVTLPQGHVQGFHDALKRVSTEWGEGHKNAVERYLAGEPASEIMASFGLCHTTIYKWLECYESGGLEPWRPSRYLGVRRSLLTNRSRK